MDSELPLYHSIPSVAEDQKTDNDETHQELSSSDTEEFDTEKITESTSEETGSGDSENSYGYGAGYQFYTPPPPPHHFQFHSEGYQNAPYRHLHSRGHGGKGLSNSEHFKGHFHPPPPPPPPQHRTGSFGAPPPPHHRFGVYGLAPPPPPPPHHHHHHHFLHRHHDMDLPYFHGKNSRKDGEKYKKILSAAVIVFVTYGVFSSGRAYESHLIKMDMDAFGHHSKHGFKPHHFNPHHARPHNLPPPPPPCDLELQTEDIKLEHNEDVSNGRKGKHHKGKGHKNENFKGHHKGEAPPGEKDADRPPFPLEDEHPSEPSQPEPSAASAARELI
ncbi:hypothetical protein QCA50_016844 [Cerrena zonata]|uniref:Uncharacterized protein n=1 Tax=Cerrena zonata TaxID=2478898 RepID=A0AAW0FMA2_9APHY